jgi:hypothetical protein
MQKSPKLAAQVEMYLEAGEALTSNSLTDKAQAEQPRQCSEIILEKTEVYITVRGALRRSSLSVPDQA